MIYISTEMMQTLNERTLVLGEYLNSGSQPLSLFCSSFSPGNPNCVRK